MLCMLCSVGSIAPISVILRYQSRSTTRHALAEPSRLLRVSHGPHTKHKASKVCRHRPSLLITIQAKSKRSPKRHCLLPKMLTEVLPPHPQELQNTT